MQQDGAMSRAIVLQCEGLIPNNPRVGKNSPVLEKKGKWHCTAAEFLLLGLQEYHKT